ncbi:MAG: anthranilate synthase component I [Gammaproteobacteria bacterium]|nr:MAG: anthranilate synthase component I [Gammaproteobacteria bacterium]
MTVNHPDLHRFAELAQARVQPGRRLLLPIFRRLFSDALTPVLAYRRLVRPDDRMAPSFLLESVVGGERIGRYSYLGTQPIAEVVARRHEVTYRDHKNPSNSRTYHSDDPLREMDQLTRTWELRNVSGLPEFTGGWVGYAGYDTVRYLEGEVLPSPPPDDRNLPDLHMQLYNDVIIFDHVQKAVLVVTHVMPDEYESVEHAYQAGGERLDELCLRLTKPHADERGMELLLGHIDLASPPRRLPTSTLGEGGYQHAVEVCKQYIAAGDAFQIVPSQRFELITKVDPFDIYRSLRVVNPSPYMFYLQIDGGMLVGSSPEILCKVEGDIVISRPLAGTRRRGRDREEDLALERELLADPKDRAEHIMLVDLHRNDVGRVAVPGSIELDELLTVERYSHVMHISSTVKGRLREGLNAWDALRVTLPVGTVSGAPKVRAMQIIDELEKTRRGPYAGAVGYADFSGNMDMAIALRTMVVLPGDAGGWKVHLQAGGGIVADSDPEAEHQETVNKAAALAKAVDLAELAFG